MDMKYSVPCTRAVSSWAMTEFSLSLQMGLLYPFQKLCSNYLLDSGFSWFIYIRHPVLLLIFWNFWHLQLPLGMSSQLNCGLQKRALLLIIATFLFRLNVLFCLPHFLTHFLASGKSPVVAVPVWFSLSESWKYKRSWIQDSELLKFHIRPWKAINDSYAGVIVWWMKSKSIRVVAVKAVIQLSISLPLQDHIRQLRYGKHRWALCPPTVKVSVRRSALGQKNGCSGCKT